MKLLGDGQNRRNLVVALKGCLSAALIAWAINHADFSALGDRAGQLRLEWLIAAVGVMLLQVLVANQRWVWILRELSVRLSFPRALRMVFVGLFFNQTLPTTLGGDIIRVYELRRAKVSLGAATSSIIFDRVSALLAILIIIASSLPVLYVIVTQPAAQVSLLVVTLGALVGCIAVLHLDLIVGRLTPWRLPERLKPVLVSARWVLFTSDKSTRILGASVIVALISGIGAGLMARGLSIDVDILSCCILIPPVILLTTLPISLAGWGVREAAMVVALGYVNVATADALLLSITFGLTVMAIGTPGGILWLTRRHAQAPLTMPDAEAH